MPTSVRRDASPRSPRPDRAGTLHRLTGALPLTAFVLLIAVAAALLSPSLRHEVRQSFQRQPERYVELYFTNASSVRTCPTTDGRLTVLASVRSHLATTRALGYDVVLTAGNRIVTRAPGTVSVAPGRAADFGATFVVPDSDYLVTITLTGRSERLTLHCTAGA